MAQSLAQRMRQWFAKGERLPLGMALTTSAGPGAWAGGGGAADTPALPASYPARVAAAVEQNPIAARAVRLIGEALAAAPLKVDAADAATAAHVRALVMRTSGGQTLIESLAQALLLHGDAWLQLIDRGDGTLGELYALRPDRMTLVVGEDGWPFAADYRAHDAARPGSRAARRLLLEDARGRPSLIHLRVGHPADDHAGAGALAAAGAAIALHNSAARWNRALIDNAARPSGALVHEAGGGVPLADAQFERLKAEMAAQFQGSANAGRPMLLDGGLRWQPISLTPAEMDFAALKDAAARDIACAFGVPPMLLGVPGDATYANYAQAMKALWRHSLLPMAARILGGINEALAPWGHDARVSVDLDAVPELSEDRARLWEMVAGADFLSAAEKRVAVGIGALVDEPQR